MTVFDLYKKLQGFDVRDVIQTVLVKENDKIIDMNREDQIFQRGIDSKGQSLDTYNPLTQGYFDNSNTSDKKGSYKSGTFNLYWTGQTYKNFRFQYENGMLTLLSDSRGNNLLESWGGSDIFGLTPKNAQILNYEILMPELINQLKRALL